MQLLYAVIDELYTFAKEAFLGIFLNQKNENDIKKIIENKSDSEKEREKKSTFRSTKDILRNRNTDSFTPINSGEKNILMYSGGVDVPVCSDPTFSFDSVIYLLNYGDMVMVLEQKGRWSKIVINEKEGWVLRENLADRAAYVYPDFVIGEKNSTDEPNTIRLRAMIGDEFACGFLKSSLRSEEYILYKLTRKNIKFIWPDIRPRLAGNWHNVLRGKDGVYISIQPKEHTVIEYLTKDGQGALAYVEAVFPDSTIKLSEVFTNEEGRYHESLLTQEEWKELSPLFIDIKNSIT